MLTLIKQLRLKFILFRLNLINKRRIRLSNRYKRISGNEEVITIHRDEAMRVFRIELEDDDEIYENVRTLLTEIINEQGLSKVRSKKAADNFIKDFFGVNKNDS